MKAGMNEPDNAVKKTKALNPLDNRENLFTTGFESTFCQFIVLDPLHDPPLAYLQSLIAASPVPSIPAYRTTAVPR
jgi:hypothetical protein